MLRFVGCDVHKRTAVFTILLEEGTVFAAYTVPVTREALTAFAQRQLHTEDRLAMEATSNTWAVAGVLRPFVAEIVISNPLRTRAIAEAKIKTDKVDSLVLAELLRCDYLPVVWQPDQETQRLRRLTHRRAALVSDRTRLKNRLHSILHHSLIPLAGGRQINRLNDLGAASLWNLVFQRVRVFEGLGQSVSLPHARFIPLGVAQLGSQRNWQHLATIDSDSGR